jgi:hypothetical protein
MNQEAAFGLDQNAAAAASLWLPHQLETEAPL